MNPTDVETRLRAMYAARADAITDAELTKQSFDEPRPPGRGRVIALRRPVGFLPPILAAAAVVLVVAGVTGLVWATRTSGPSTPANGPSSTPLTTAPSASVSTQHTSSPTPSTPTRTSAPAPAGSTKPLTVYGVVLQVPVEWSLGSQASAEGTETCLSATGSVSNCTLEVAEPLSAAGNIFRPNATGGMNQGGDFCGPNNPNPSNPRTSTVAASQVMIDGQLALYKRYTSQCSPGPSEQWVIPTAPGIIFFHTLNGTAADQTVETVVRTAKLPGTGTGQWLGDDGIITHVALNGDAAQLTAQRIVPLEQGNYLAEATTTWTVPSGLKISVALPGGVELTVAQLRQWADGGTGPQGAGPLSGWYAELTTAGPLDGSNPTATIGIDLQRRPGHPVTPPTS